MAQPQQLWGNRNNHNTTAEHDDATLTTNHNHKIEMTATTTMQVQK